MVPAIFCLFCRAVSNIILQENSLRPLAQFGAMYEALERFALKKLFKS